MMIKAKISALSVPFTILILFFAALYSCSDTETPLIPVDKKCEVRAGNLIPVLPCSVYYYSNVSGNVTNTSISFYDDSGKHTVNYPVFPFTKSLYLTEMDTSLIYATSTSNPSGGIFVIYKALSAGYSFEERDSCFK